MNTIEHWQPNTDKSWKPPPTTGNVKQLKIPKVKEPKDNRYIESNSCLGVAYRTTKKVQLRMQDICIYLSSLCNKVTSNKVSPISSKVPSRYLDLEPLCCISSCLVRGGCKAVVSFEICYSLISLLCVFVNIVKGPTNSTTSSNPALWIIHPAFYYTLAAFDVVINYVGGRPRMLSTYITVIMLTTDCDSKSFYLLHFNLFGASIVLARSSYDNTSIFR